MTFNLWINFSYWDRNYKSNMRCLVSSLTLTHTSSSRTFKLRPETACRVIWCQACFLLINKSISQSETMMLWSDNITRASGEICLVEVFGSLTTHSVSTGKTSFNLFCKCKKKKPEQKESEMRLRLDIVRLRISCCLILRVVIQSRIYKPSLWLISFYLHLLTSAFSSLLDFFSVSGLGPCRGFHHSSGRELSRAVSKWVVRYFTAASLSETHVYLYSLRLIRLLLWFIVVDECVVEEKFLVIELAAVVLTPFASAYDLNAVWCFNQVQYQVL